MTSRIALLRPWWSHATIVTLAALAGALAVAFRDALATLPGVLALLAGVAIFPVQEYLSHRFFLHARPSARPWLRRAQERLHYAHHADPDRRDVLFGPLWAVLPLAFAYWLLFLALTRSVALGSCVSLGSLLAYLYYEHAHFVAHAPIVPWTRWGRAMKAHHLRHHHKNEFYWFGVTSPLVDDVAGTNPDVRAVDASPTVRDLPRSRRDEGTRAGRSG